MLPTYFMILDSTPSTIKLITESASGCIDSILKIVQLINPPTANFSSIDSYCGPLLVDFINNSQGYSMDYQWDF